MEIMIVVAIIGLLAAIAIPNLIKARVTSQKNSCISNMKQIEGAKHTWAIENKKASSDTPTTSDLYGAAAYIRDEPTCPGGGTYTIGQVSSKISCSLAAAGHTL